MHGVVDRPCRKLIAVCADAGFAFAQVELAGWLAEGGNAMSNFSAKIY